MEPAWPRRGLDQQGSIGIDPKTAALHLLVTMMKGHRSSSQGAERGIASLEQLWLVAETVQQTPQPGQKRLEKLLPRQRLPNQVGEGHQPLDERLWGFIDAPGGVDTDSKQHTPRRRTFRQDTGEFATIDFSVVGPPQAHTNPRHEFHQRLGHCDPTRERPARGRRRLLPVGRPAQPCRINHERHRKASRRLPPASAASPSPSCLAIGKHQGWQVCSICLGSQHPPTMHRRVGFDEMLQTRQEPGGRKLLVIDRIDRGGTVVVRR